MFNLNSHQLCLINLSNRKNNKIKGLVNNLKKKSFKLIDHKKVQLYQTETTEYLELELSNCLSNESFDYERLSTNFLSYFNKNFQKSLKKKENNINWWTPQLNCMMIDKRNILKILKKHKKLNFSTKKK